MAKTMKKIELDKQMKALLAEQSLANFKSDINRARSISVGHAGGGVTEVSLRRADSGTVYYFLQPVEVIELIHQLAANVGCHINLQPRDDFSSWRAWNPTHSKQPAIDNNGHPPHPNSISEHFEVGAKLPHPEEQPGMKLNRSKQNVVATKKTVNGRSTKRAARAS
jgi:hypothetical protein